jgi:hypothetical protein|tara:strand:+ start:2506 stop:4257 length:1752 start_codon:yes stop_codon:yes gene_type:complete
MKILKLLNKVYLSIFIIIFSLSILDLKAEEELVDIWKIEKKIDEEGLNDLEIKDNSLIGNSSESIINYESTLLIQNTQLEENNIILAGIYDPEENGLSIDMWSSSDGEEIIKIFNRIKKIDLSNDAKKILDIALLTNSFFPSNNIEEEKFLNFKFDYLIESKNLNLIKIYLSKNNNYNNSRIIKFYINHYLSNSDLENACKIFKNLNLFNDNYLAKFKIYCLINENKREEAQLIFDLTKELGLKDKFFENKFNLLMGYASQNDDKLSDKNILDFHLSHRVNKDLQYKPNKNTPKIIWKYLSSSNLLQNISEIDLENIEEISIIENATHENIYEENDLFELYKRFQFNINQLLTANDTFKLLPNYEGRALLYQRLLLSNNTEETLELALELKNSFNEENIGNAFNLELSNILSKINSDDVPSNFSTFYEKNLINETSEKEKVKINNKIIHQSKLINYFQGKSDEKKLKKDLADVLKNVKKNKKYFVSNKDLMLLESLVSDGFEIPKKYQNLFKLNQSIIPNDIGLLINNKEIGLVLLRLVEFIGEDELKNIGPETVYFMISILNQLNLDKIRNDILLKVLPLKI